MQVKKIFSLKAFLLGCVIISLWFCGGGAMASPSPLLIEIQAYLNSLTTVKATFKQINPKGAITTGRFYLWRPGLMRLEYNPPSQELIIADGTSITHVHKDLQEVSSVAIDATPAAILLAPTIQFDRDVTIRGLHHYKDRLLLTLTQADNGDSGELTLIFKENPLLLAGWTIKDIEGRVTHVALDNIKTGLSLPRALFVWNENY